MAFLISQRAIIYLAVLGFSSWSAESFVPTTCRTHAGRNFVDDLGRYSGSRVTPPLRASDDDGVAVDDAELVEEDPSAGIIDGTDAEEEIAVEERDGLKRSLIKLAAAYDRGYGATKSSRGEVDDLIQHLEGLNPTADAAKGITGNGDESPLAGIWRMCWTTAQDVLTLASSPISTVGSIYQVIDPPIATNIIDLIPRAQALFPPGLAPPTLLRAEVTTRASPREGRPLRVGLDFEAVKLQPVEVLGFATDGVLPPLSFNLPRISTANLPGVDPDNSPGYFDVAYLDDEMLIIRQNAPGGLFVLLKADNYDP